MTPAPVEANSRSAGALRLLIGGRTTRIPGFTNIDLFEGPEVDIRTDASDLKMIDSNTAEEIYASHILEHFSHARTVEVLSEWHRVLKPGGKAYISVPDLMPLIPIIQKHGLCPYVRNMLYGDQIYDLAFHYTIFTFPTLAASCVQAGFSDVKRIQQMPYGLDDCSHNVDTMAGAPVSVHIEARK